MPGRKQIPSFQIASGTTAERDNSYNIPTGSIFFNTDTSNIELSGNVVASDISGVNKITFSDSSVQITGSPIIEYLTSVCDGSTLTRRFSNLSNVEVAHITEQFAASNIYADLTGGGITYQPPPGTKKVIYRFTFAACSNNRGVGHIKFFIDDDEVTAGGMGLSFPNDFEIRKVYEMVITIGVENDISKGYLLNWNSQKTLTLKARRLANQYGWNGHRTEWWDGATASVIIPPVITLIALS